MTAFIVEWESTDVAQGIRAVVGPFATPDAAMAFAEKYEMGHSAEAGYGGYSDYEIVSAESATRPNEYAAEYMECIDTDPDTGDDMTLAQVEARIVELRAGTHAP